MESVCIILIIVAAVVVVVIGWIYKDRLTEGFFKGTKDGVEAGIKVTNHNKNSNEVKHTGVNISGDLSGSKIDTIAGRDIVKGSKEKGSGGSTTGVNIEATSGSGAEIRDIAGRDIIDDQKEENGNDINTQNEENN